jgi:hypothetical protein
MTYGLAVRKQWSNFISRFTSHNISCHPATSSPHTLIQSFITMTYGLAVSKAVVWLYFRLHFAHYFLPSRHTIIAHSDTVLHYNPFPWKYSLISLHTASLLARYGSSSQQNSAYSGIHCWWCVNPDIYCAIHCALRLNAEMIFRK